jgi:signal transduction histidine kinase
LARAAARSLGNRRFEIIALREIAQLLTDKGSYSEAVEVLKTAEKVAKKFGSVYFNKDIHIRLFAAESAAGQHKPAAFRMRDYVAGEQFQNDSSLLNHRLLRLAESSSAQVGDDELAAVFDSIQLPEKAISEFKANAKLIDSLGRKLSLERLESRRSAEKTLEQHREEISSFETKVQTAQRSFLITSCLATLLAFGLGAIYLASRYSNVAEKLDETEVSTLENRELCNELSVRLSRMERMDSLNRMAGGVAHDFNNILASVIGNAEIIQMKSNGEGDSFTQERLSGIIESAEKAANLSRQMLTYAGRSHTRRELVDVNKLIAEYKPVLMSACGREQNLSYELSTSPLVAPIDSIQLETALLNLVTNSSEASGSQGSIVIRSGTQSIETVEDTSLFGTRNSGGEFGYIEVYDEGTGISQEDLERIFEPFYTKSIVGRGLGLAVVYGVIENHDGFVQCHSTLESSTSFKVLFPLQVEQPKNGRADWQVETGIENGQEMPMSVAAVALDGCNSSNQMDVISRSNGSRSVLVVDDEHAVRELCNALLSVKNVEVIQAIDGEEGLGLALQNRERLDFVLLDITMPKMDGEEVLQAFLENDFDVPVVLMTGYSANKQEKLLEFPNVVSIIQKPFRAAEIFEQFEKIASSKL